MIARSGATSESSCPGRGRAHTRVRKTSALRDGTRVSASAALFPIGPNAQIASERSPPKFEYLMHHTHQPALVVFSIVIAILASYTALELAVSMAVGQARYRLAWIAAGAVAMGAGIWSMHFVDMLAL